MVRGLSRVVVLGLAGVALAGCSGGSSPDPAETSERPPDGVLTIGTLLPRSDRTVAAPIAAAVRIAVSDVNRAGGVNGQRIALVSADTSAGERSVERLAQRATDVVVGTGSSDTTLALIERIVSMPMMLVSPSDTAPALSTADTNGLFWRTAAPDTFQAAVLAQVVADAGSKRPAVLAQSGRYGEELGRAFQASVAAIGGSLSGPVIAFDADSPRLRGVVRAADRQRPDGVVLIGGPGSAQVIPSLASRGLGPSDLPLFLVDANADAAAAVDPAGALATMPTVQLPDTFRERLRLPGSTPAALAAAAAAYDAVVVSALASVAATSDGPGAVAGHMVPVTSGGAVCRDFRRCQGLLGDGRDVDYQGLSGPIDFQANGDPGQAVMGVARFEDGKWVTEQVVEGTVPPPMPAGSTTSLSPS